MSVEASGWAFRQAIPAKPKMVLMALADQADERTGHVCYGKTDMEHIARKASVPLRSLYRYISALVLNGYLLRESGKGRGHANTYWVRMDRPAADLTDWKWAEADAPDETDDPQDVVEKGATVAPFIEPETAEKPATMAYPGMPHNGRPGMPYVADHKDSDSPENIKKQAGNEARQTSFSPEAQALARGVQPVEEQKPLTSFGPRSPEAAAISTAYGIAGKEHYCESVMTVGGRIYHHGDVTPQLLALKETPPRREWPVLTRQQAGAWNELLRPLMPVVWRPLVEGSRAPWCWPPRKDGTLCTTGPPENLMTADDVRDLDQLGKTG